MMCCSKSSRMCGFLTLVVIVSCLSLSFSQEDDAGQWRPTQSNNTLLAELAGISVNDLSQWDKALNARGILGIIPFQQVASYLADLNNDPGKSTLIVRWQTQGAKCTANQTTCTKSAAFKVLEYSYGAADASDCQTFALVSVDTLLPRHSLLIDGDSLYLPSGSPQYTVAAAPSFTAGGECTYVVAYPAATEKLATLHCDDPCRKSPCLDCADSVDALPAGASCQSGPGISLAMQAAYEGAAACLSGGPISPAGRFKCSIQPPADAATCGAMQCFPGHAGVQLASGGRKLMRDLRVGDAVRAVSATGKLIYSPVYFFGHREAQVRGQYVRIAVQELEAAAGQAPAQRVLQLSPLHFVHVARQAEKRCGSWKETEQVRAQEVQIGDVLWAAGKGDALIQPHRVVAIGAGTEAGAFNPYTLEGNLLVDGVLASSHSEWVLDPAFEAVGLGRWLPLAYQVLFFPLRLTYHILPLTGMQAVDAGINANWSHTGMALFLASLAVFKVTTAGVSCVMSASPQSNGKRPLRLKSIHAPMRTGQLMKAAQTCS